MKQPQSTQHNIRPKLVQVVPSQNNTPSQQQQTMPMRIPMNEEEDCLDIDDTTVVDTKPFRRRRVAMRRQSIDVITVVFLSFLLISSNDRGQNSNSNTANQKHDRSFSIAFALLPRITTTTTSTISSRGNHQSLRTRIQASSLLSSPDATTSPLFSNRIHKPSPTKILNPIQSQSLSQSQSRSQLYPAQRKLKRQNTIHSRSSSSRVSSSSSPTALYMVLTTPESIIEQASTVNLLDDLINESVRTSARRPIMMQFDPSSGWIWRRWKGTVFAETWTSCGKYY